LHQRMQLRECQMESGSQLIAQLTDPFLAGHVSLHHAVGGRECSITGNRQEERALLEQVEDTGRSFFIGLTGPMRDGFAIVADGVTVHQTDTGARGCEPFIARLPIETRRLHGDPQPMTMGFVQVMLEGGLTARESLSGMCKCQFAAADASLRSHTSPVFGFAHIDSHQEPVSLLHIRFTLLGGRPDSVSRMGHSFGWDSDQGKHSLRGVAHEITISP
jgi:hypothetical protein